MSTTYFRQCRLRRRTETGVAETTSWLPEQFAKVGGFVKLKDNDTWVDGWRVETASERVDERLLPDYRKAIRAHRDNTGDSLPKGPNRS